MRIRLGCEIVHDFQAATPMIVMFNVHWARFGDLERPDHLSTTPSVPIESYRRCYGNWCSRLVAPAGRFTLGTDGVIRDSGEPDPIALDAVQHRVQDLPADTILFQLASRCCETDCLVDEA